MDIVGLIAVAAVAIFSLVFGGIAIMQEMEDRRRERDEIASVIAELRQYYKIQNQLRLQAEQDRHDDEIFEGGEQPIVPPRASAVPEWRGHSGFGERRAAA